MSDHPETIERHDFVPAYPDADAWERMSAEERAEFERKYQDAVARAQESTGSDNDDPEESVSRTMA